MSMMRPPCVRNWAILASRRCCAAALAAARARNDADGGRGCDRLVFRRTERTASSANCRRARVTSSLSTRFSVSSSSDMCVSWSCLASSSSSSHDNRGGGGGGGGVRASVANGLLSSSGLTHGKCVDSQTNANTLTRLSVFFVVRFFFF